MDRDLDYDGDIRCKNHICETLLPRWFVCNLCTNCDILFGRITKQVFPYPEYWDNPENPKWLHAYQEELNAWEDKKIEKYENEMHLRTCPLCRN